MGKMIEALKKEDGIALIVAIGAISIMIIVGTMVVVMARDSNSTVSHDNRQTQAINIADAGVDNAIAVTIANFNHYFPGGRIPSYPGDGQSIYDSPQQVVNTINGQQVVEGTYQAWVNPDPDNAGNALITSTAQLSQGANPSITTVRVSVQYTVGSFDYAFLSGTPTNPSDTTFTAQSGGDDDSAGANIKLTGKVNVNGRMTISAVKNGDNDDHEGQRGTVSFQTRTGYTDPVTYYPVAGLGCTGTACYVQGTKPAGTQPTQGASAVPFPTVDFSKFSGPPMSSSADSHNPSTINNYTTVNLPQSGYPAGGWARNGNVFSISSDDFQKTYGMYQVVNLTSAQNGVTVQIIGGTCTSVIHSSIVVPGSTNGSGISELDIIGPGLNLQPTNGLAILSGEGLVYLQTDVVVGAQNAGALIYLSGQNGVSQFKADGNLTMFGSLVVNGPVTLSAIGKGEEDDDQDNKEGHTHYCGGGNDGQGQDAGHTTNMSLTYDSAFLKNLGTWWTWTGGSGVTAVKYNYRRS